MEALTLRDISFFYPEEDVPALDGVTLSVKKGEFITLCGKSGCGKTTLLRQLKSALAPHGSRSGALLVEGVPLEQMDGRTQSEKIGFVLQSPEEQIVTDKVWHELAFGLESLGYDNASIRLRVAEMASFFGIQGWFYRDVSQLSGGQKQLLNLASVMALQPSILLLDEPTSQLDPIAAADFLAAVGKLNRELGITVLLTEHRLEEALPLSDRCVVMDGGKIIADGPPRAVGTILRQSGHQMFSAMPAPMRIWAGVPQAGETCPVTVREGRSWLAEHVKGQMLPPLPVEREVADYSCYAIEAKNLWFRYEKDRADVVKGLSLTINKGSLFAIVGGNGTGKTTALSLLSGLNRPDRGEVRLSGSLGVLPQNPQTLFVKKTVELDLYEMLADYQLTPEQKEEKVRAVAALCELTQALLRRHPYDLSGGEQQRAALAKVLLLEPEILLLDEPTKGLDSHFKGKLAHILKRLAAGGHTVVLVSHDVEFCASYADRCAFFFDGAVVTQGPPRTFFSGNSFYTTAAERMAREYIPGAVTARDVIRALGGEMEEPEIVPVTLCRPRHETPPQKEETLSEHRNKRLSRRTVAAAVMILLLIPLTLFVGTFYLGDRKYYFISLLVVLETMLPFFLVFEGRKPKARELVVIATLCAIAVAGRAAFFFVPQFKPVAALTILAAVAFGGEAGFLVGSVSMLASNLFFTQGPWTPFQMFAMGIIGFLAGVLFRKGLLGRGRLALCSYGGLTTFFIYGFIMNTYSVFQVQSHVTWGMIWASCLVGIPMDLIHAAATVFFLAVAGPAMLEKLDRIKVKYGLME